jgi:hypothetical protein
MAGTRSCVLVLSGVIRKSLNGSGVLVNHGGLRRLPVDGGMGIEKVKRKKIYAESAEDAEFAEEEFCHMIESTEQLEQAIARMGRMQRILEWYRADILPKNPRNFGVFAECPLEEIRRLEGEISEYVARLDETAALGV